MNDSDIARVFFVEEDAPVWGKPQRDWEAETVRMVVTGEEGDDWARENIQGPIESMIKMTIFINNFRDGILRGM